ncbi:MAG: hypothetical protein ACYCW6_10105, partial [Candidatus Xenobia bacterium]
MEAERDWHESLPGTPARAAWLEMLSRLLHATNRREVHTIAVELEMLPDVVACLLEGERDLQRWHGTTAPTTCPPVNHVLALAHAVREGRAETHELEAAMRRFEADMDHLHAEAEELLHETSSLLLQETWLELEDGLLEVIEAVLDLPEAEDPAAIEAA